MFPNFADSPLPLSFAGRPDLPAAGLRGLGVERLQRRLLLHQTSTSARCWQNIGSKKLARCLLDRHRFFEIKLYW